MWTQERTYEVAAIRRGSGPGRVAVDLQPVADTASPWWGGSYPITFELPAEEAAQVHVGQRFTVTMTAEPVAGS